MDDWTQHILFLDGEAMVIDKPAGLPVHPGPSTRRSLEDHLDALRFGFQRRPSPVHRLDRDTSGCLLLARNPRAHRNFSRAFELGLVSKTYLAVLDGVPAAEAGEIDLALAKISSREKGWRMRGDPQGKPASTRWRLIAVAKSRSLVEFTPLTGRTHQLRVHAAEGLGIPISGDPVYGPVYGQPSSRGGSEGAMMLHARSLRLGRDNKPAIEAKAPLPSTFLDEGFRLPDDPPPQGVGDGPSGLP